MAAIFETIEKGLAAWGFDLCQPFAGWSLRNRVISSGRLQRQCVRSKYDSIDGKRDDVGNSGGTNMRVMTEQVGNSRNIWEHFIAEMAKDDALYHSENPLDEYYAKVVVEA